MCGIILNPGHASASDDSDVRIIRYLGDDRYATSITAAIEMQMRAQSDPSAVVFVAGGRWQEAAAAVPLAVAAGAPLLLTPAHELRTDIIVHLVETDIDEAIIVTSSGERGAVNPAVVKSLRDLGIKTTLISDEDSYGTTVAVAHQVARLSERPSTVILANGEVFADALSAGQIAVQGPSPILLSPSDALPVQVLDYMVEARIERVILMGGESALSHEVERSIRQVGIATQRIAGADRYQTAAAAADASMSAYVKAGCYARRVALTRADAPFDSFSASRLSSAMCMPVLLASPERIPAVTAEAMDGMFAEPSSSGGADRELHVFGGEAAIRQAVIDAYLSQGGVDARCKPRGQVWEHTVGSPLPPWSASSTGVLQVAMLFMDFPDAPAHQTTHDEYSRGAPFMERYLESASYGKLDVEITAHHEWLRADRDHSEYITELASGEGLAYRAGAHAVALADPDFDFNGMDTVVVVFTSGHFSGGGNAGGSITADGSTLRISRINHRHRSSSTPDDWGVVAAHEIAHNMGIADLYPYDRLLHPIPDVQRGHRLIKAEFGLMRLRSWFVAAEDDPRIQVMWRWPNGESLVNYQGSFDALEMLAWSRFQFGWLDNLHVRCMFSFPATETLHPLAQPAGGTAMIVLPVSDREVVVVENRRQMGEDQDFVAHDDDSGTAAHQRLLSEGVLVYSVNTSVRSGELPIRVAGDDGYGVVSDFPLLSLGESVTIKGYKIEVVGDDNWVYSVAVTHNA